MNPDLDQLSVATIRTLAMDAVQEARSGTPMPLAPVAYRQLGSRCPGHPGYRWTSGVEATTGPLGRGVATSVVLASAVRAAGRQT